MTIIGPISSVYDFLIFGILRWVFHASTNESLFHTGWFVESLAMQTLVILVIRTAGNPLKNQQQAVGDQRAGSSRCCDHAAVYAFGEVVAIYTAPGIFVGAIAVLSLFLYIVSFYTVPFLKRSRRQVTRVTDDQEKKANSDRGGCFALAGQQLHTDAGNDQTNCEIDSRHSDARNCYQRLRRLRSTIEGQPHTRNGSN